MTTIISPGLEQPGSSPDLVILGSGGIFDRDRADFAIAGPNDRANPMGLRANQPLATAIALCLMTDAHDAPGDPTTPSGEIDRRGWPGDGFDIDEARGEAALGSLIWTRYRYGANAANAEEVARAAEAALQPIVDQGLVGEIAVTAQASPESGLITANIRISAPSGRIIFNGPFAGLWEALSVVHDPLAP